MCGFLEYMEAVDEDPDENAEDEMQNLNLGGEKLRCYSQFKT